MLTYALKSALCLAALYVPYLMMLRNESFARFNRCVLLSIVVLSLALPFIHLPWLAFSPLGNSVNPLIELGELTLVAEGNDATPQAAGPASWNWLDLLGYLYIIGVAMTLLVRACQIIYLYQRIRRGTLWVHQENGVTIYCHTEQIPPFSWMNEIVISQEDYEQCGDIILAHERAHVRLGHSADMLLVMCCQTLQWFNPFAWLLGDSIQEIHEYEVDRAVLRQGVEIRKYQLLLIKKAVGSAWPAFANNLKNCSLKKRFNMMNQKQTNPWRRTRALYVLPVTLLILSAFACTAKDTIGLAEDGNVASAEFVTTEATGTFTGNAVSGEFVTTEATGTFTADTEPAYDSVEVMPEFPGGTTALMQFMAENIVFPKEAETAGASGRVIISFVLEKTGKVSEVEVVNSKITLPENIKLSQDITDAIESAMQSEAVRVANLMPDWTPGQQNGEPVCVKFTMPVTFRLR